MTKRQITWPALLKADADSAQSIKTKASKARELSEAKIFVELCRQHHILPPVTQHSFAAPERKWTVDFAWPTYRLALEVEGGVWSGGKHGRGSGIIKDMEKANGLAVRGWRLLRVTPIELNTIVTLALVEAAMNAP